MAMDEMVRYVVMKTMAVHAWFADLLWQQRKVNLRAQT